VIGALLGGIGLFLLGMGMMSSGLQAVAGDRLQGLLQRWTSTPARGVLAGTVATALVQSSSATTLATVGFVSAGLISFPAALGLIYGANLGTTSTAWIVSVIGLKIDVAAFALPLIGLGAALKLFAHGRRSQAGLALAGFGMIFLGIDVLQEGMAGMAAAFDPAGMARPGLPGALLLVGIGALMTVVLQASSAAMATTLTAVHAGTLSLEQAAFLAIGQNVGTTITAALGSTGGSLAARRTAAAHLLFNLVTGLAALVIIVPFVAGLRWIAHKAGWEDPAVQLSLFHTSFNLLGLALFLPQTRPFARLVERLVKERATALSHRLVERGSLLAEVRLESARLTVRDVAAVVNELLLGCLIPGPERRPREQRIAEARAALDAVRDYLAPLKTDPSTPEAWRRHLALLHATDHLDRLVDASVDAGAVADLGGDEPLGGEASVESLLVQAGSWLEDDTREEAYRSAKEEVLRLGRARERRRPQVLERTARGELSPLGAEQTLHSIRLAERIGEHTGRVLHYLKDAAAGPG